MLEKTPEEMAFLEANLAEKALGMSDGVSAKNHFFKALERLEPHLGARDCDSFYISTTLKFSNLCFLLGQGFKEAILVLFNAVKLTEANGDKRSEALVNLHLGRFYYFMNKRDKATQHFIRGKDIVEILGDDDILNQAGEFLGFYFITQGHLEKAKNHFEHATAHCEPQINRRLINISAAIMMSNCDAYMGQFHRAIGRLNYHKQLAINGLSKPFVSTISAVLGAVLIMTNRINEATSELIFALEEATRYNNAFALHISQNALAYKYLLEGHSGKARDLCAKSITESVDSGIVRLYTSPFFLEMLYEFHHQKLPPIPKFTFWSEVDRMLNSANIHLKGVALRLRAKEYINQNKDVTYVQNDLENSENLLIRCGDPIQLGKTRVEIVRLKLIEEDIKQAQDFAQRAWNDLAGCGTDFYPKDLLFLLKNRKLYFNKLENQEDYMTSLIKILDNLIPTSDINRLLNEALSEFNGLLGAERSGIFWFDADKNSKDPILKAACNLSSTEVFSNDFRNSLSLIYQCFKTHKPAVHSRAKTNHSIGPKAAICIPFELNGRPQGVLYHDNSYLDDCFDILDKKLLKQIAQHISKYVDKIHRYNLELEEQNLLPTKQTFPNKSLNNVDFLATSKQMLNVLAQADKIATSDATIMITGETGVGKELLAQRIHQNSMRNNGPFVVINVSAIPETLIESELFGHEKGAFTGAEKQKKGYLEIAHKGTLFFDEIGEIPKSIQVKLLRVLQDKTVIRLGGNHSVTTDFRMLAATNRILEEEVTKGRLREDFYYRINVIPIVIPPLRERFDDIALIAQHYINIFTAKHNMEPYYLTPDDTSYLLNYDWPGNVRELKNIIERAVLLSDNGSLEFDLSKRANKKIKNLFYDRPSLDEIQRRYISFILNETGGKLSGHGGATEILGMKRSTLFNRMKKLGLR